MYRKFIDDTPARQDHAPVEHRLSVSFAEDQQAAAVSSSSPQRSHATVGDVPSICSSSFDAQGDLSMKSRKTDADEGMDSDEEYSASISAVLAKRQLSTRKLGGGKRRRGSVVSPTDDGQRSDTRRRQSSVFTLSECSDLPSVVGSPTTGRGGGSPDPDMQMTDEEMVRLHRDVLREVRAQPLPLRRKIRLVRKAKAYIKDHEGALDEKLAHGGGTMRDHMIRVKLLLARLLKWCHRELSNLARALVPWEKRIKSIEAQFGSVVASYFVFLRWLCWLNVGVGAIFIAFVIVPEVLAWPQVPPGDSRKTLLPTEEETAYDFTTLWNFEGILRYSPIFYGYYSDSEKTPAGYRLPFAYFMAGMGAFVYSFFAVLRKMATNARASKLSAGGEEAVFSWKLFAGWDFTVGHPEAATNKRSALIMSFRELLLEEREKTKQETGWRLYAARAFANLQILGLLASSAYAVVLAVQRSINVDASANWFRQNELQVVLAAVGLIFPNMFAWIGRMEKYHPRAALRWQLARILALYLVNFYTLISALFGKVDVMITELESLRTTPVLTTTLPTTTIWTTFEPSTTLPPAFNTTECARRMIPCSALHSNRSTSADDANRWPINSTAGFPEFSIMVHENNFSRTYFAPNLYPSEKMKAEIEGSSFGPESSTPFTPPNTTTTLSPDFLAKLDQGMREAAEAYARWKKAKQRIMEERNNRRSKRQFVYHPSNYDDADDGPPSFENETVGIMEDYMDYSDTGQASSTEPPVEDSDRQSTSTQSSRLDTTFAYQDSATGIYANNVTKVTTGPALPRESTTRRSLMWVTDAGMSETTHTEYSESNVTELTTTGSTVDDEEVCFIQLCFSATQYVTTVNQSTVEMTTERMECFHEDDGSPALMVIPSVSAMTEERKSDASVVIQTDPRAGVEDRRRPQDFTRSSHAKVSDPARRMNPEDNRLQDEEEQEENDPYHSKRRSRVSEYLQSFFSEVKFHPKIGVPGLTGEKKEPNPWDRYYNVSQVTPPPPPSPRKVLCWPATTTTPAPTTVDYKPMETLRYLCWETMLGQELVKITVMDLVMTLASTFIMDFVRALMVRFLNPCWCWDLEKTWPEYGEFNVAENVLHLVNNQGMIWMGMFFSPGLPVLNLLKLVVLVYARSWIVTTCNVPHETVFRASRSNNFYFGLLLLFLFLCTLPVGYFVVRLPPSWHCGPFSSYHRIYRILTQRLLEALPVWSHAFLDYLSSPGVVIPLLVLLTLFIYYLVSLAGALREANDDLRIQLRRERTEERRKMFKLAEKRETGADDSKWNALLPHLKSRFSSTSSQRTEAEKEERAKDVLRKYVRRRRARKQHQGKPGAAGDESSSAAPPPPPPPIPPKPASLKGRKTSVEHENETNGPKKILKNSKKGRKTSADAAQQAPTTAQVQPVPLITISHEEDIRESKEEEEGEKKSST